MLFLGCYAAARWQYMAMFVFFVVHGFKLHNPEYFSIFTWSQLKKERFAFVGDG